MQCEQRDQHDGRTEEPPHTDGARWTEEEDGEGSENDTIRARSRGFQRAFLPRVLVVRASEKGRRKFFTLCVIIWWFIRMQSS